MPIYMDFEGIKGDATDKDHKKWIVVDSCQWGVGRGISTPTGAAAKRESSNPSVAEVVITKPLDVASGKLFGESLVGVAGKKVKFHFAATDGKIFLEIALENVLVSSYSLSSGGDRPSESWSLNFTKIEYTPYETDEKGAQGKSPSRVTFDVSSNTKG